MDNIEKIKNDLKANLSKFRYEHSIMVAEEAKKLAEHYNLNVEKAYVTGLVHDIAKEFSDEENKKWIYKYQLPKELLLPEFRNTIHADIGAVVVKEWYELDEEICNAIKYHTIGDISMTEFDKIIFLADKIARKVASPFIEKIRKLTYENLGEALKQFLIGQKEKIESSGGTFHPNTVELLRSL